MAALTIMASAVCDGVASTWWIDKALELRGNAVVSEPLSRVCVVNYQSAAAATAALCQWPNAALSGVRFRGGQAMRMVDEAIITAGVGRTALRNVHGLNFAHGDSRALPFASQCDLLLVDTAAPRALLLSDNETEPAPKPSDAQRTRQLQRRADFTQSLLSGLSHALEAAARSAGSVVIFHGPQCTPSAARVDSKGVHCTSAERCYYATDASYKSVACWSTVFQEHVAARSLLDAECRDVALNSTGEEASGTMRTCIGRVNAESPCAASPPSASSSTSTSTTPTPSLPLLAKGGPLAASNARVRFDTGLASADRLMRRSARYFIALPCGVAPRRVCLLFKDAATENWIGGLASADGSDGLRFVGPPRLVVPHLLRITEDELRASGQLTKRTKSRLASLTHNLAVLANPDGSYLLVGGKYHVHRPVGNGNTGIWRIVARPRLMAAGSQSSSASEAALPPLLSAWVGTSVGAKHSALLAARNGTSSVHELTKGKKCGSLTREQPTLGESARMEMTAPRLLLTGHQKGCIERRSTEIAHWVLGGACEYDGRLSVARHPLDGRLLLYSRANMASHGQRHVQVTSSVDDGATWSRFRPVRLEGHEPSHADIYYFAVSRNPAHNASLLAVYPLVQHFRGCLCLSASLDGRRWTRPEPLMSCGIAGERATSHPAAGLIERDGMIDFYVHEGVPGIYVDASTPLSLHRFWSTHERDSRLSRYSVTVDALRRWTEGALKGLS